MEYQGSITINGKEYEKGKVIAWYKIHPFFLLQMGTFGGPGLFMAYAADGDPLSFLYPHEGFACLVYVLFYVRGIVPRVPYGIATPSRGDRKHLVSDAWIDGSRA